MQPRLLILLLGVALASIPAPAAAPDALSRGDLKWLARVTFGLDSASVERLRTVGRNRFLDEQLKDTVADPPALTRAMDPSLLARETAEAQVKAVGAEQQRINSLASDEEKQKARMALNQAAGRQLYETARRHLLRAITSPAQLREQMTWFWMNRFNVFSGKAHVRWTLAEYEDAVRTSALDEVQEAVALLCRQPATATFISTKLATYFDEQIW